jgi:hypothetical protein
MMTSHSDLGAAEAMARLKVVRDLRLREAERVLCLRRDMPENYGGEVNYTGGFISGYCGERGERPYSLKVRIDKRARRASVLSSV